MSTELPRRLAEFFTARFERGVTAVYLFGSHAAGRAHRESDIDVGVLLEWDHYQDAKARFAARVQLTAELISALSCNDVDVVILNDAPPLFGRRIVQDGRCVFVGCPTARQVYERDVALRAADLAPFLRKMQRIKLEALAR